MGFNRLGINWLLSLIHVGAARYLRVVDERLALGQ
jgi:hypothetical protein